MGKALRFSRDVVRAGLLGSACFFSCNSPNDSGDGIVGGNDPLEAGLEVVAMSPANGALQVDQGVRAVIQFDGIVDPASLDIDAFSLTTGSGSALPGAFATEDGGKTVVFTAASRLDKARDYTLELSPTICDLSGRALSKEYTVTFRTFDDVPPVVLSSTIAQNATGVSRTAPIGIDFDESLDPTTVTTSTFTIEDSGSQTQPATVTLSGKQVLVTPIRDLVGSASYTLRMQGGASGVKDRSGNPLAQTSSIAFTTAADTIAPILIASDPLDRATGVSPRSRVVLLFDESVDLATVTSAAVEIEEEDGLPIAFQASQSADGRTITIMPVSQLSANSSFEIRLVAGANAIADVSGNRLTSPILIDCSTGSDVSSPTVTQTLPAANATRVSPNTTFRFTMSESVKSIASTAVVLTSLSGAPVAISSIVVNGSTIEVTPAAVLAPATAYDLRLKGGYDGVQDSAGNPMASDFTLSFTTSESSSLPSFLFFPQDSSVGVPLTSRFTVIASEPLDPSSVSASTFYVSDTGTSQKLAGSVSLTRGNRAIVWQPDGGLPGGAYLEATLVGGPNGVRAATGNWATRNTTSSVRTGYHVDSIKPELHLTLNAIAQTRTNGLVLPPSGFTLRATAYDPGDSGLDPTTLALLLTGPTSVPSSAELFGAALFTQDTASVLFDEGLALPVGSYALTGSIRDLSGNLSTRATLSFTVESAAAGLRPFERTQFVWAQFDADRENGGRGDGVADFDEDLLDYGLLASGDPIGRNAWMRKTVIDGVLTVVNELFARKTSGAPQPGSVNIVVAPRQPCSGTHMRIAVGGPDPGGQAGRAYGSDSTGILGRAFYDHRNASFGDNNTGTAPGVGVFSGELFLYQARVYLDLYPYFITSFGKTFGPLSPHMGGTPAGKHGLDATVLASDFDYANATSNERARYDTVMGAADDLAVAVGVVLAHEIGHTLGLVANGSPSSGLHGDASLHNSSAGLTDVMSAIISYESLISVDFSYRPINLAYLRERILVK